MSTNFIRQTKTMENVFPPIPFNIEGQSMVNPVLAYVFYRVLTEKYSVGLLEGEHLLINLTNNNIRISDNGSVIEIENFNEIDIVMAIYILTIAKNENFHKVFNTNLNNETFSEYCRNIYKECRNIQTEAIVGAFFKGNEKIDADLSVTIFNQKKSEFAFNEIKNATAKSTVKMNVAMSALDREILDKIDLSKFVVSAEISSLANSIARGTKSCLFYGPAGTGKSTAADIICKLIDLPIKAIINCTTDFNLSSIGKWIPEKDTFVFLEGPAVDAMENGGALILEELNASNPKKVSFLFSVMDKNAFITLDSGRTVKIHEDFRLFATMNPRYKGTTELNKALKRRFQTSLYIKEVSDEQLEAMIQPYVDKKNSELMIRVFKSIREKINEEELEETITPRALVKWAKMAQKSDIVTAAQYSIASSTFDNSFKEFIMDMIEATFDEDYVLVKKEKYKKMNVKGFIPEIPSYIKKDKNLKPVMQAVADGTAKSVILYGGTGSGKTTAIDYICAEIGLPIIQKINCTNGLDHYLFGKYIPDGNGYKMVEQPATQAIKNGGAIVLEEINFADPSKISFLNSLLDFRGFVELPNGEIVKAHPDFRFFATMNPGYAGTNTLNASLFDRFDNIYNLEELPIEAIRDTVQKLYGTSEKDFAIMCETYNSVKNKIIAEERDEVISPDIVINWAREAQYVSLKDAANFTILNIAFDDEDFRDFILSILDTVSSYV